VCEKEIEEGKFVDGMRVARKYYHEQEWSYRWLKLEQTLRDKD